MVLKYSAKEQFKIQYFKLSDYQHAVGIKLYTQVKDECEEFEIRKPLHNMKIVYDFCEKETRGRQEI